MSRMKLFALEEDVVVASEIPEMVESVDEVASDGSIIENDVDVVQDSSEQIGDLKEATDVLTEAVDTDTPITNEALEQFVILRDNVYKNLGLDPVLRPSYLRTAQESISTKQALKFALEEEKGFIKTTIARIVKFFKDMLANIKAFFGKIFGAKAKVDKGLKDAPAKTKAAIQALEKTYDENDTFLYEKLFSKTDDNYKVKVVIPYMFMNDLIDVIKSSGAVVIQDKDWTCAIQNLIPIIKTYDYMLKEDISNIDELLKKFIKNWGREAESASKALDGVPFIFIIKGGIKVPVDQYKQYFAKGIEWNQKLVKFAADTYKKEDVVKDIEGVIVEVEKSAKDNTSTESISLENDSGVSPEEHRKQVAERVKEAIALNKMALQSAMEFLAVLDKVHTFTRKEFEAKQNGLKAIAT